MARKAFLVQVELDIQAITCPGVWLCSNGLVSLQLYLLDSCIQTSNCKPIFPLLCHEKFVFYKTFYTKHRLNDLQRQMGKEWLYCELIQWQSCEIGNVLATFQTTLDELLFPSSYRGAINGADVDLLMEPTKAFPGTIAPKIEISTKTTIEETICNCNRESSSTVVVNPKMLLSCQRPTKPRKTRRVCHSMCYSRSRKSKSYDKPKPPWRYKKAEEDLLSRRPRLNEEMPQCKCQDLCKQAASKINYCKWAEQKLRKRMKMKCQNANTSSMQCNCAVRLCNCGSGHRENNCPVCEQYKGYFNTNSLDPPVQQPGVTSKFQCPRTMYTCAMAVQNRMNSLCNQCNCGSSHDYNKNANERRLCVCGEENKQSLTEKIHERLTQTLGCVPNIIRPLSVGSNMCDCIPFPKIREEKNFNEQGSKHCESNDGSVKEEFLFGCPMCNYCNS